MLVLAVVMYAQNKPKMAKVKTAPVVSYGNSDSITEYEMKIYDYFLASDQLEGRNLPSRGFDTAALYVASHLAEWGLKPGGSTTGTNGPLQPYLMPFELVSKSVIPGESKASLSGVGGGGRGGRGGGGPRTAQFEYGKDWSVAAGGRGAAPLDAFEVSGNLAFVGNGYVINKTKIDPFAGIDVKGKIVVVAGLPAELAAQAAAGGRGGGRGAPNPLGEACTDFMTPEEGAAELPTTRGGGEREWRRARGWTEWSGIYGAEVSRDSGLSRGAFDHGGARDDQRHFSGREEERIRDFLWRGFA
jgi:hypothetical protein